MKRPALGIQRRVLFTGASSLEASGTLTLRVYLTTSSQGVWTPLAPTPVTPPQDVQAWSPSNLEYHSLVSQLEGLVGCRYQKVRISNSVC